MRAVHVQVLTMYLPCTYARFRFQPHILTRCYTQILPKDISISCKDTLLADGILFLTYGWYSFSWSCHLSTVQDLSKHMYCTGDTGIGSVPVDSRLSTVLKPETELPISLRINRKRKRNPKRRFGFGPLQAPESPLSQNRE